MRKEAAKSSSALPLGIYGDLLRAVWACLILRASSGLTFSKQSENSSFEIGLLLAALRFV